MKRRFLLGLFPGILFPGILARFHKAAPPKSHGRCVREATAEEEEAICREANAIFAETKRKFGMEEGQLLTPLAWRGDGSHTPSASCGRVRANATWWFNS